jgi:hypothetical protein
VQKNFEKKRESSKNIESIKKSKADNLSVKTDGPEKYNLMRN